MKNTSYKAQYDAQAQFLNLDMTYLKKSRCQRFCGLVVLLILPFYALADTLSVTTDRSNIEMGDLITLQIEADFQTRGSQLNLDSLKDQFEILGRQQSNRIEVINGKFSSTTAWQVTLLAKHIGELVIPPLEIAGVKSQPYKITVTPIQKKNAQNIGNYFVESSLNKKQAYIQEEVLYSLKFYFLGNFTGSVRPPKFEKALSVTLKEQNVYGKQLNGQQYTVYEWQYALYPQQSGDLTISGPVFSGIHLHRGRQKGIQEAAESHQLKVLPVPESFSKQADNNWLPAKSVTLKESWPALPNTVHVGDSLNRTLILDVVGLKASQLPQLTTDNQTGFKVYADKADTDESVIQDGLRSQLKVRQAIIPTQEGDITLPEQKIVWWNTTTQKLETATIAARTVKVLPALANKASSSHISPITGDQSQLPASQSSDTLLEDVSRETNSTWTVITILLGLAWFVTLGLLYRQNQRFKTLVKQLEEQESSAQNRVANDTDNQETENSGPNHSLIGGESLTYSAAPIDRSKSRNSGHDSDYLSSLCNRDSQLSAKDFYHQLRAILTDQFEIHNFSEIDYKPLSQAINPLENHLFNQAELTDKTLQTICSELEQFAEQQQIQENQANTASKLAPLYKH